MKIERYKCTSSGLRRTLYLFLESTRPLAPIALALIALVSFALVSFAVVLFTRFSNLKLYCPIIIDCH